MGALWSHGLAAGWLCLFLRLRLLRLLGLDQLRLSYSDKLEGKRQTESKCWTGVTQTISFPFKHCRRRTCEGDPTTECPCAQLSDNATNNQQQKAKQRGWSSALPRRHFPSPKNPIKSRASTEQGDALAAEPIFTPGSHNLRTWALLPAARPPAQSGGSSSGCAVWTHISSSDQAPLPSG